MEERGSEEGWVNGWRSEEESGGGSEEGWVE